VAVSIGECDYFNLFVVDNIKSWKCSLKQDGSNPFYLSKDWTIFGESNEDGSYIIGVPKWLQLKHRQLCGDEAYEQAKKK
jgi:hypothetical protein